MSYINNLGWKRLGIKPVDMTDVVGGVVVITPPLPRDGGTARTAIHVHTVNLIEIREDDTPFRISLE